MPKILYNTHEHPLPHLLMAAIRFRTQLVSPETRKSNVIASGSVSAFNAGGMVVAFAAAFAVAATMLPQQGPTPMRAEIIPAALARTMPGVPVAREPLTSLLRQPLALRPSARSIRQNVRSGKGTMLRPESLAATAKETTVPSRPGRIATRREERMEQMNIVPGSLPFHSAPVPAVNPYNKTGVYMTASSVAREQFYNETMDELIASGGSTMVIDVKGYWVYYDSVAPMAKEIGMVSPALDLPVVLAKAKEKGLYTIARYIAVKDEGLVDRKPGWQMKHKDKNYVVYPGWIDPANEEALEYNRQILCELAGMPGLDEINLDYIRMSSTMPYSTGYTGDEKAERLMKYIRMARETIDSCGPQVKLGVSTYAILGWNFKDNRETIGQDVVQYAPYVDVISPMAYPQTFSVNSYYTPGKHPVSRNYWLVYRTLTGYAALLGPDHAWKLRPWIQAYSMEQKGITDQMNAVADAGYCGFQFWSANNTYGTVFAAMKKWTQPERCASETVSTAEPKHGGVL
jgi:hypothetical protein